jgi:hypothetical protein
MGYGSFAAGIIGEEAKKGKGRDFLVSQRKSGAF